MTLHKPSLAIWSRNAKAMAEELDAKFPREDWTSTYAGHGEIYSSKTGLQKTANHGQEAVDLMISSKAEGDRIAEYVWRNRVRLGVRYVIWNRRIISRTNTPSQWRTYTNPVASRRGTASGDHTNHVHVSRFVDQAYTPEDGSAVTPEAPKPTPPKTYPKPKTSVVYLDRITPGARSSDSVYWVQVALTRVLPAEFAPKTTGTYDKATVAAATEFQRRLGDDELDGDLGQLQVNALLAQAGLTTIRVEEES